MQFKLAALALAASLAACGGGGNEPPSNVQAAAQALSAKAKAKPMAAAQSIAPIEQANQLMNWAEANLPAIFPGHPSNITYGPFQIRYYAATNIYLGVVVQENVPGYPYLHVYVLGDITGGQLIDVGLLTSFMTPVNPNPDPDPIPDPGPGGTASDCYNLALADTQGTHVNIHYTYSGIITGNEVVDTLVGEMSTFEGHSARKTTVTTTGSHVTPAGTVAINTTGTNYNFLSGSTLTEYGGDFVATGAAGPFTLQSTIHSVYNPGFVDPVYTLAPGGSATPTSSGTTTITTHYSGSPFVPPDSTVGPTPFTSTNTITYVGQEQVSVGAGTFNACKFVSSTSEKPNDTVTNWIVVGKGVPVKTVSIVTGVDGGTMTIEATSATINGAPI